MANSLDEDIIAAELESHKQRQRLEAKITQKNKAVAELQRMYDLQGPKVKIEAEVEIETRTKDKQKDREEPEADDDRDSEDEEKPQEDKREDEKDGNGKADEEPDKVPEADELAKASKAAEVATEGTEAVEGVAAGAEAGAGAVGFLAATSEIWVPAVAIIGGIILILGLFMFVSVSLIGLCNSSGAAGWTAWLASKGSWVTGQGDFCKDLKTATDIAQQNAPSNQPNPALPTGMVDIPIGLYSPSNFYPTVRGDYPQVKQAVLDKINEVYRLAQAAGLSIIITSARREAPFFAFSCHFLGEAVDFVITQQPTQARIAKLFEIGQTAGFGYVRDEYNNPSENATGSGHIHMQLNTSCSR